MEANPGGPQSQETTSCQQLSLPDSNSLRIPQDLLCNHLLWILQDMMGANNSSLTPLNCILKNWDRFDRFKPQGLKKTHLVFLCDTAWPQYPLEDGEQWPVGGSLKYNTVLQLDRFCKKQGKRVATHSSTLAWKIPWMEERLHFHFSFSCIGGGNGNPLQCSCLENPRDGGDWWAAIYGVAQSQTRLKRLSSSSSSMWLSYHPVCVL